MNEKHPNEDKQTIKLQQHLNPIDASSTKLNCIE